jgi:hypothetical protein
MSNEPHSPALFGPLLLEFWEQQRQAAGRDSRPMSVEGARFRHSWAGFCARRIQYEIQNREGMRDFDLPSRAPADNWRLEMGTIVHDYWQAALQAALPDAEIEHITSHKIGDAVTAGHGDAFVAELPKFGKVCIELKSRNGYGYKQDIGANKNNQPEGPSWTAKRQGALNALAEDADVLVILHISLEAISPGQMPQDLKGQDHHPRRITAEWWYTKEEYAPWAENELKRVEKILELTDAGKLAPRHVPELIPPGGRIVNVNTSQWQKEGKLEDGTPHVQATGVLWSGRYCDYCPFQVVCHEEGL